MEDTYLITALENNIVRALTGVEGFLYPYDTRTPEARFQQILLESAQRLSTLKPSLKGQTPKEIVDIYRLAYFLVPPFDLAFLEQ
jgi:hypothetical protein